MFTGPSHAGVWGGESDRSQPGPSRKGMWGGTLDQGADPANVIARNKFNNFEIRRLLNFPAPPNSDANYAEFYQNIAASADDALRLSLEQAQEGDIVQLELQGESIHNSDISVISDDFSPEGFLGLVEKGDAVQ